LRPYPVTVETEKGAVADETVTGRALEALARMPAAVEPTVEVDRHGVLTASFTVYASGMDEARTIAGQTFAEALREAGVDARWNVIETDEGPLPES
jgi:hypothetical protein